MHFFHDFRGQDPTMRDAHPSWVSTESRWIGVLVPTLLVLFGQLAFTWFGYAVVVFASRRDIPCSDQVRSEGCAPPDSDVSPYPDSTQQLHHEEDLDLEAISLSVHDLELLSWKFDFFSRKVRSLLDTKTQVIPHKPNGSLSHRYGKSSKGLNRVNGEALLDDLDYLLAELDRLSVRIGYIRFRLQKQHRSSRRRLPDRNKIRPPPTIPRLSLINTTHVRDLSPALKPPY